MPRGTQAIAKEETKSRAKIASTKAKKTATTAAATTKDEPKAARPTKRRFRPGTKALREIRRLQKGVNLLIPRAHITRIVRDLLPEVLESERRGLRIQKSALDILHETAEHELNTILRDANKNAIHAGRVTLQKKDFHRTLDSQNTFNATNFRYVVPKHASEFAEIAKITKKAPRKSTPRRIVPTPAQDTPAEAASTSTADSDDGDDAADKSSSPPAEPAPEPTELF